MDIVLGGFLYPVFNHVAPYRYMLPTVYLSMTYIANPDLFACGCRTWICLDISHFHKKKCHPSRGSAWLSCPKTREIRPPLWGREVSTQFAQQFARTVVTAIPVCRFEP